MVWVQLPVVDVAETQAAQVKVRVNSGHVCGSPFAVAIEELVELTLKVPLDGRGGCTTLRRTAARLHQPDHNQHDAVALPRVPHRPIEREWLLEIFPAELITDTGQAKIKEVRKTMRNCACRREKFVAGKS